MSSRPRNRRRRSGKYTGVLRGTQSQVDPSERISVPHGTRDQGFTSWRLVSFMIIVVLSVILVLFFVSDVFYVHSVGVAGTRYLTKEEIFTYSDVANLHLFWVDPDTVRDNVMRSSAVADVRVIVGWPPRLVQIVVEEREPALVWEQDGVAQWVDLQGGMMSQREERPDLIRISANSMAFGGPLGAGERLPEKIVHGALQLQQLLPEVTVLRYDPLKGLGYQNENGWDIWFGTGTDMDQKVIVFRGIAENLRSRGIQPVEVNIMNPHKPYFSTLWGR